MTIIKYKDQKNEEQERIAIVPDQIVPIDLPKRDRYYVGFQKDKRYKPEILTRFQNEILRDVAVRNLKNAIKEKDEEFHLEGVEWDRDFSKIGK